jgi:hypothetical protein
MELREYIEAGIERFGTAVALAKVLDQNVTALRNVKAHRQGLPNYACVKLADLLGVERIEVIAASELVTEKNPERQKVWLPFVQTAEARRIALSAVKSVMPVGTIEEKAAQTTVKSVASAVTSAVANGVAGRQQGMTGSNADVASVETKTAPEREPSKKLVAKGGIEPPTRGFSIRCSTD